MHWFFPRVGALEHDPEMDLVQTTPVYRDATFRFVSVAFSFSLVLLSIWLLAATYYVLGALVSLFASVMGWHSWSLLQYDQPVLAPAVFQCLMLGSLLLALYLGGLSMLPWAVVMVMVNHFVLERRVALGFDAVFIAVLAPVAWQDLSAASFFTFMLSLVFASATSVVFNGMVLRQDRRLRQFAVRDPLTHAYNRRSMMERLEHAMNLNRRYGVVASIIMFDIDHFKQINDQLGHSVGDSALKELVRLLQQRLRRTDMLFRFGGEEFVILLSETESIVALKLAEQCCRLLADARIVPRRRMTVSCGVAEIIPGESALSWLERCDAALYRAKREGRNRACLALPTRAIEQGV